MRTKLTAGFVKGFAPRKEREIAWDQTLPGFGLMVTDKGHRSYVVQYRIDGRSRRYTINGGLALDDARKQARAVLAEIAAGRDPVVEKRRRKLVDAGKHTLKAVAENYLIREGDKLRTTLRRRQTLQRLVYPTLGALQVDQVRRSDINRLLDQVEDQNGAAMADQVLSLLRRIMNWHASRDDDFESPIVRGMARRTAEQRERDRVLSDDELRAVWKAAEAFASPWGQFVRFLVLTAARRTEVAGMSWSEIKHGLWTIPRERYKTGQTNKTETTLPLSAAAKRVLEELPRIKDCDYPFTTNAVAPISGFSTFKLKLDIASGATSWTQSWRFHDLRRTARSLMSRAGVNPDIAERCLGHAIGGVRGVYDRHRYVDEMRHAFEALANQIERIVHPVENVVAMTR
jgi:integrase